MDQSSGVTPADWSNDIRYAALMQVPQVRELIAASVAQSKKTMSAQNFLRVCDLAFKPLVGVSISQIAAVTVPISTAVGIKTGKQRNLTAATPTGAAIVATLCSMGRQGLVLERVEQLDDGCLLMAKIPSDMWTFGGVLSITVCRAGAGSQVEASTHVPGQRFDWGKSKQVLAHVFGDVEKFRI